MSIPDFAFQLLNKLVEARIEFIVVGGVAAVMLGAPITTADVDIVHKRTPENVQRLLSLLRDLNAYMRFDLANRKLFPSEAHLMGHGHVNLATEIGPIDLLCELAMGEGYEQILDDTELVESGDLKLRVLSLPRLAAVKAAAGRPKDRLAIPVIIAAHEQRTRGKRS